MNRASLADVEAFLAVATLNSFGAAARELGLAQSTVSRRISNLETRLGHRLILRTTRKVTLTDSGVHYAADLREVMARLEAADARLQSDSPEVEGTLRITMPTAFGRTSILPIISSLASQYQRLRFELDLSDRYVDILDSEFDIAIRMTPSTQSGTHCELIHRFALRLCASPLYLEMCSRIDDMADLINHTFLAQRVYAPAVTFPVTWHDQKKTLQINPRISVSDATALKTLCLKGSGLGVLPDYLIEDEIASGALVQVLPGLKFNQHEVFAVYPRHKENLATMNALLSSLRSSLRTANTELF
ncbi:LysR family transcriptional regulator [Pseudomonas putida]|uniref:LysR family transcriptional regulator n=1 Tax=Pseudomonas putida TaxID=303 RepID=UPI00357159FE